MFLWNDLKTYGKMIGIIEYEGDKENGLSSQITFVSNMTTFTFTWKFTKIEETYV